NSEAPPTPPSAPSYGGEASLAPQGSALPELRVRSDEHELSACLSARCPRSGPSSFLPRWRESRARGPLRALRQESAALACRAAPEVPRRVHRPGPVAAESIRRGCDGVGERLQ